MNIFSSMNLFGKSSKRTATNKSEQGIELQEYPQHTRTTQSGQTGTINFPFGSTKYKQNDDDLTVSTIGSKMPGLGSRMMNMVAEEAGTLGKDFVRTTLTAPSAHNFYLKMGLHPSTDFKTKADQRFGEVINIRSNQGKLNQQDLERFNTRFKYSRINPVWEGRTETVRQQSDRHWQR